MTSTAKVTCRLATGDETATELAKRLESLNVVTEVYDPRDLTRAQDAIRSKDLTVEDGILDLVSKTFHRLADKTGDSDEHGPGGAPVFQCLHTAILLDLAPDLCFSWSRLGDKVRAGFGDGPGRLSNILVSRSGDGHEDDTLNVYGPDIQSRLWHAIDGFHTFQMCFPVDQRCSVSANIIVTQGLTRPPDQSSMQGHLAIEVGSEGQTSIQLSHGMLELLCSYLDQTPQKLGAYPEAILIHATTSLNANTPQSHEVTDTATTKREMTRYDALDQHLLTTGPIPPVSSTSDLGKPAHAAGTFVLPHVASDRLSGGRTQAPRRAVKLGDDVVDQGVPKSLADRIRADHLRRLG